MPPKKKPMTKLTTHRSNPMAQFFPSLSSSALPLSSPSIDLTFSNPPSPPSTSAPSQRAVEKPHIFGTMGRRLFMRDRIDGNVTTVNVVMPCLVKQLQINEIISTWNMEYLIPKCQLTQNSPLLTITEDHRFVLMSCAN